MLAFVSKSLLSKFCGVGGFEENLFRSVARRDPKINSDSASSDFDRAKSP